MKPSKNITIIALLTVICVGCMGIKDTCVIQQLPENYHTSENEQSNEESEAVPDSDTLCEASEPESKIEVDIEGTTNDKEMSKWIAGLKKLMHEEQAHSATAGESCSETLTSIEAYVARTTSEFNCIWQSHEMEKQDGNDLTLKLDELKESNKHNEGIEITKSFFKTGYVPINKKTSVEIEAILSPTLCAGDTKSLCEVLEMILSDYQHYTSIIQKTADRAHFLGND